jgi:hypothetical protein
MTQSETAERASSISVWPYRLLRFGVAFLIISYGFAKLNGSQFTILSSELDKPMGQVSGFWLTWYYFGYSPIYGNFIGIVQIVCGILLMFRKTTLLGSCVLFPMVANIVLIDVFYGVDLDALMAAILILLALLGILSFHKEELLKLFWRNQNRVFPGPATPSRTWAKNSVRVLLIAIPAIFMYWVANYNNRLPTPLDGAWDVVSVSPQSDSTSAPISTIFFERNRAYMCVFKRRDGTYQEHHFEIDAQKRTITIWNDWLRKGKVIFSGTYDMNGDDLRVTGKFSEPSEETTMVLKRRNRNSAVLTPVRTAARQLSKRQWLSI